jgi:hypothetical protein
MFKIVEGIKHRNEPFGGVVESPLEGLLNMTSKEYQLFLSFKDAHEITANQRDFIEELVSAGVLIQV